jgi:uncharacterized membrane protein YqjE
MSESNGENPGLVDSLKRVARTAAAIAQNRLELLLVELQEERSRLFDLLLLAATGIVFGLMTLIVLTFTIVVMFWDGHRIAVLAGLGVTYLAGATLAFRRFSLRLRDEEAFSGTLAELKKDRAWLERESESAFDSASRP